jgi:hypothetical protein
MRSLNVFQRLLIRSVPFRLNLFLQLNVWKKGLSFDGMNEAQRAIAWKRYLEVYPPSEPYNYGPPFEPPWVAFPEYERFSMGFRMGGGEDYICQFRDWYYSALRKDIDEYQRRNPEPEHYSGFYSDFDKKYFEVNDL